MTENSSMTPYFPHIIQINARLWRSLDLGPLSRQIFERSIPDIIFYRQLALRINRQRSDKTRPVLASQLNMYAILLKVFHYLIDESAERQTPNVLSDAVKRAGHDLTGPLTERAAVEFTKFFPPGDSNFCDILNWHQNSEHRRLILKELLLLRLAAENPALENFREILNDSPLSSASPFYPQMVADMEQALSHSPQLSGLGMSLTEALRAPIKASPLSLSGQVGYIREHWGSQLPSELLEEVLISFDILLEEERAWGGGGEPGPPPVMQFGRKGRVFNDADGGHIDGTGTENGSSVFGGYEYPEFENFSADADWMSNVVLMAKMVYVWLQQLSQQYGIPVTRLDQVPDIELDRLSARGFTGLWLIGIWERSPASQRIKQLCGNPEAIASAYSLYDYEIAEDLGGWEALSNLKERALRRGIRLASDMVPNHTGIYSRWVMHHPDWFVQTDYPPFPTYQFNGEDLSHSADIVIQIEDGYWTKTDAAVVFRIIERRTGRIRYLYHGNDGTSIPWNDTAQLNYLIPDVREAVIQTILHVARSFPIIRFDAAMTLAKKHFQRLWFPVRGLGGGIPSRAGHGMSREEFDAVFPTEFWREVVDRVASEVPGTLLLAEAFWLMEGYFVRTLGMHRVYNSAFMNMLKQEENAKYRQTIKNVLEFNPEVLKRFVNFMNNPDEKTAVEQFGREGKYFGACVLLATMPGLPMFGHGQIEGFHEKYGMEYKCSYWNETPDEHLVWLHEQRIFPLLRRRWLFSGSDNFVLYDFYAGNSVDENVFAYSNRIGDHCGLVLYHNRYSVTSGWIRESAAFAIKDNVDSSTLRRTTLAETLGLENNEQIYYSFRDHTLGLVFLRNSRELAVQGLYAELGEYEFHVFTDFRKITDNTEGAWSKLCTALNGRGVENLEDELKQLQYSTLNAAFRTVLDSVHSISSSASKNNKSLLSATRLFLTALSPLTLTGVRTTRQATSLIDLPHYMDFIATLSTHKPSAKISATLLTKLTGYLGKTIGRQILFAWLLLKDKNIGIEMFGLDYSLKQSGRFETDIEKQHAVELLKSLLAWESIRSKSEGDASIERAFTTTACSSFIQQHESGGIEWFNKERFEELLEWSAITTLMEDSVRNPNSRAISTRLGWLATENLRLNELAELAGYRTKLFLSMLKTVTAFPFTEGAAQQIKKQTGKNSDVQRTTQSKVPKVPNLK